MYVDKKKHQIFYLVAFYPDIDKNMFYKAQWVKEDVLDVYGAQGECDKGHSILMSIIASKR